MLYPNLKFPTIKNRPFFYTNFVQTLDGKTAVNKKGYWPIGSQKDYQTLVELRAHADCLIHGANLARKFGEETAKSLQNPAFKALRKRLGKTSNLPYYIITKNPKSLFSHLPGVNPDYLKGELAWHLFSGSIKHLIKTLYKKGYQNILVEGGPTLLGSFFKEHLIDEVFLTIAPKIYGNKEGQTLTLVEGYLFPQNAIKKLKLLSVKPIKNELFLRYKVE